MNATEFLAMGGYGFFVWGSYGVTALLIIAEVVAVRLRCKAAQRGAGVAERAR
jgi:heme exporter protein D